MAVADTKVPLFKDPFWHFQIKVKFRKKITRQGSVRLPDADFFWIIPCKCRWGLSVKLGNTFTKSRCVVITWKWKFFLLGCGSYPLGNYAIERNFKTFGTEGNSFLENILPDISHKLNKRGWSKDVLGGIFFEDDELASVRGAVCVGWARLNNAIVPHLY